MTDLISIPNESSLILTGIVSGIGFVIILIFIVLQCICCEKSLNSSPSNGVIGDPNRKRAKQRRPLFNSRTPDQYDIHYANNARFPSNAVPSGHRNFTKNVKPPRVPLQNGRTNACVPHRALPAPPSSNNGNESLTRESSTSELYASVDKNPPIDAVSQPVSIVASLNKYEHQQKQNNAPLSSAAVASHSQSHLYAKIYDDHHVYSKIWSSAAPGTPRRFPPVGDPQVYFDDRQFSRTIGGTYENVNPVDDIDFDPFYSRVNEEANNNRTLNSVPIQRVIKSLHHPYEYPVFTLKQNGPNMLNCKESLITDPLYSKIGSEDPYSSIKSEEHYSRVDREDNISIETDDVCDGPSASTSNRHKIDDDDLYFRYARPGPSTKQAINRRYSDGDEYTMVRKASAAGLYSTPVRRAPPPVPEKQFSQDPVAQNAEFSAEPKKEPSYRYITVRESLDALRERMEQQRRPLVSNYIAVSDPSLHYYSTISEHSYEVVPSRIIPERSTPAHPIYDDTLYIDQDELLGTNAEIHTDVCIGHDLNSTSHSDDMTIRGSHVTLVQIEAVLDCNKSDTYDHCEPARSSSVPPPPPPPPPMATMHNFNSHYDNKHSHNLIPDKRSIWKERNSLSTSSCASKNGQPYLVARDEHEHKSTPRYETKTCFNENACESRIDPEYPTTFCFCHAPSTSSKKFVAEDKSNVKKRLDDKTKRDRHF